MLLLKKWALAIYKAAHSKQRICENCIYWLQGFRYETERVGRCVTIFNSGATREALKRKTASGEDRFAFVDLPRDEPVYTSDHFGCVRFIPNNERGRYLLMKYEREYKRDDR